MSGGAPGRGGDDGPLRPGPGFARPVPRRAKRNSLSGLVSSKDIPEFLFKPFYDMDDFYKAVVKMAYDKMRNKILLKFPDLKSKPQNIPVEEKKSKVKNMSRGPLLWPK